MKTIYGVIFALSLAVLGYAIFNKNTVSPVDALVSDQVVDKAPEGNLSNTELFKPVSTPIRVDERLLTVKQPQDATAIDLCNTLCMAPLLDILSAGVMLSKDDYGRLTHNMNALVTYLSNNPDVVQELAVSNGQVDDRDSDIVQANSHILRQLPFSTLSYVASDLVFSTDISERRGALELIDFAYKSNTTEDVYAHKEDLKNTLESFIYAEPDMENKIAAFEILANHEWNNTNINALQALDGVFNKDVDEALQGRALQTSAMFKGQVAGFEDALLAALVSDSESLQNSALSAVQNLGVFGDKNDAAQADMLYRVQDSLNQLKNAAPEGSYLSYRIDGILKQHFSNTP